MKFVYALMVLCCTGFAGYGQVTLISATGDGGFETGASLAANGWTVVNPTPAANNQWVVGTAAGVFGGSRCVYISNDGGTSYAYTNTVAKTAHFYRDVTIPPSSTSITLSFQWKGLGELSTDRMLIYTAPTSVTPVANIPLSPSSAMAGATLVWSQPNATTAAYTPATVTLPATLSGTTVRLIFTWQTDATLGVSPGGALDNISLTYVCASPQAVTGSSSFCAGTSATLTDATPSGAWSSSDPSVGSISSAGVLTGLSGGTTTISYTVSSCLAPATMVVTVVTAPAPITGPSSVCLGSAITLGETALVGTWSSSAPSIANVSFDGTVFGLATGTATITFVNSCGPAVTKAVTVNPLPSPISYTTNHVCAGGGVIFMSDLTLGGTWDASPTAIATATTGSTGIGIITGVSGGTAEITYTSPVGCMAFTEITVDPTPTFIVGATPICVGNSITLTDGLPGGTWSSSVTGVATIGSASGVVTGIMGGTTIISYTNACGSATVVFTVNPYPGPIVGEDSVCIGGTSTFANPLIGGTWISGNPAVASIMPASGVITPLAIGTTNMTYTMPGGCSVTRLFTVLNPPPPITGVAHVCPGASTVLSNAISGGTWSSSNPLVGTVGATTGIVTGIATDTVHIIYTTPIGCTVYVNATVNAIPAEIISIPKLCVATTTTLFNASPGGTWSTLTASIATIGATTGLVSPVAVGTATFKYTLPTGCSTTRSYQIYPLPVPIVFFSPATNTLHTQTGFTAYEWHHSVAGIIPGATGPTTPGTQNGDYYVTVTDTNGCMGTSGRFPYRTSMAVAHIFGNEGVSIYPNPAREVLYVRADRKVRVVISSPDGRTEMVSEGVSEIDISHLPVGMHTIAIYSEENIKLLVDKLVKE